MPGPARIDREDLEANFPPRHVAAIFCDDDTGEPGPRLVAACLRASRRAESILLRGWPTQQQIDVLFQEDEAVVAETCRLAMAYGVEGKVEWSGPNQPYQNLETNALKALKDLADAETRSRGEAAGAGANPRETGVMQAADPCNQYMFTATRSKPRPRGY